MAFTRLTSRCWKTLAWKSSVVSSSASNSLEPSPARSAPSFSALIPEHKQSQEGQPAYRGIGLLPCVYRVWAKARVPVVQEWERQHSSPLLLHQKGRSVLETVYLQMAQSEAAKLFGEETHSAAVMLDLSNYYEHISRSQLLESGQAHSFPQCLPAEMVRVGAARP